MIFARNRPFSSKAQLTVKPDFPLHNPPHHSTHHLIPLKLQADSAHYLLPAVGPLFTHSVAVLVSAIPVVSLVELVRSMDLSLGSL